MKITEEQKKKIKELRVKGKLIKEIAITLNLTSGIVLYWLNEEYRIKKKELGKSYYKNLPKEKKKEFSDNRKSYRTEYYRKRYNTDEEYRKRRIESSIKWNKKQNT